MRAVVVDHKPRFYGISESRVDIYNRKGRLLASRYYANGGTQGYHVKKIVWTPDSRFVVFLLISSGGHSPWHSPIHFYAVRGRAFCSVEPLVGLVTSDNFTVSAPATIHLVTGLPGKPQTLNLHTVRVGERKLAADAESEF